MKVTILGCGSSGGVPLPGGKDGRGVWQNCNPDNPKNRRLRASILIEAKGKVFLLDTSPDMRQQLLDNQVTHVDAVLYTHNHADHTHGIDEMRSLNFQTQEAMQAYTDAFYVEELQKSFRYIFAQPLKGKNYYKPSIQLNVIEPPKAFEAGGITVQPFYQNHGKINSIGYRIGNVAYSTDVKSFLPESEPHLYGLDLWVLDCVQVAEHPTHAHLDLALSWVEKFKPKRTILTHMNGSLDYDWLVAQVPPGVEVAYDGLTVTL